MSITRESRFLYVRTYVPIGLVVPVATATLNDEQANRRIADSNDDDGGADRAAGVDEEDVCVTGGC